MNEEIGCTYGRLTIVSIEREIGKRNVAHCVCSCGNSHTALLNNVRYGVTKSCGCLLREVKRAERTTHGYCGHPLYAVHASMLYRCKNPKDTNYHRYGGRGISVCNEWEDRDNFIRWALENGYKKGLQIDREDNNGNYCPENCRWVTPCINTHNRNIKAKGKSGYLGVYFNRVSWAWKVTYNWESTTKSGFGTALEAAVARNKFILESNLPVQMSAV